MARIKKREIWSNGHYLETVKNQEVAEAMVRTYERMDRYDIEVGGYTNKLPVYEIRIPS